VQNARMRVEDEVVEVLEVAHDLVVTQSRVALQEAGVLERLAEGTWIGLHDDRLDQTLKRIDLLRREVLDQPEVEEGDASVRPEEIVAGMGVAVERVQSPHAADDEAVDRLGGQIAPLLTPALDLVEAPPAGQLAREHAGR